jgi:hypothetical protein
MPPIGRGLRPYWSRPMRTSLRDVRHDWLSGQVLHIYDEADQHWANGRPAKEEQPHG